MSGFDPETWLHSLEYDDGDVEPAIRLWREVCHLGVPEDTRADEENATREAKRRKVAETEIAEAKKQLEAAEAERDRLELSREMADDDEADDDEADDKADDEASPAASPAADAGGSSVPTTPAQT
ncbi:keratin, partial [Candidatus Dependentiae bacterium]|nr:keratin [Candidatus Dependentiae bacterium]